MNGASDDRMLLQGHLDMSTVPKWYASGLQRLNGSGLYADFSSVESVDSAAVSMLLAWTRAAQRGNYKFSVSGLPPDLLSLARLYGVEDLLPKPVS
jgi:phospholipid transport system transporter-binding protein